METKFLLLLGPSGVGKTEIIHHLRKLDDRFVYISPYITRPLRLGERDKIPVTDAEFDALEDADFFLAVNHLYGVRYGTPRNTIHTALAQDLFPVLDWPAHKIDKMREAFHRRTLFIYIAPPSIEALRERLADGRDESGDRFTAGELELMAIARQEIRYDHLVINPDGASAAAAEQVYREYLLAVGAHGE